MEDISFTNHYSIARLMERSEVPATLASYKDLCYVFVSDETQNVDFLKYPTRIDAYIFVICLSGEISFNYNLKECKISENMVFLATPNVILQLRTLRPGKLFVMFLSPDILDYVKISMKDFARYYIQLNDNPLFEFDSVQINNLSSMLDLLFYQMKNEADMEFSFNIIEQMILTLAYKMLSYISLRLKNIDEPDSSMKRVDMYFKKFQQLVTTYYKQERSVTFYAERMCVSPKYLSFVIKKSSNKFATEWINDYVVLEAKSLLKFSDMTIQEVAIYLNFPNQSFFGKYFKRHTGYSPKEYRMLE